MLEQIRALFPIEGERFRVELADLDDDYAATIRLVVFEDGQIRDVKEQTVRLLPPAHRDARGLAFLEASVALIRERHFERIEYALPSDMFRSELLASDLALDVESLRRIEANPRAQRVFEVEDSELQPEGWSFAALASSLDPARRPPPPRLVNEVLEAAILERPDDRGAYSVYGDWLAENGDPRGELVAVQCALADRPDDAALREREARLLDDYAYEFLDDLAWWHGGECEVTWRYGFPDRVRVGSHWGDTGSLRDSRWIVRVCSRLRLVRELVFGGFSDYETYDAMLGALAEVGLPRGLRALGFITSESAELGDLEPGYPVLSELTSLSIESRGATFGAIELPALRSFEFKTRGLTTENLASFRAAAWPKLERFAIAPGDHGVDNCDVTLDDLDWIFAGELAVPHLGILGTGVTDVLERLAASPILPRLVTLDLSHGYVHDAAALLPYAGKLAHLEKLVLPAGIELPGVRVEASDRYIPVYE